MRTTLLVLFAFGLAPAVRADAPRPNVIVVFTDDHGYADLSCQGIRDDVRTPHVDALAKSGVRMTSGYVTAPQCVPSRAGLLSGRYQNRFGVESNGKPLDGFDAQRTIAERLKAAGYATGMIGKWHLGPAGEIVEHGFDDVFYQGGSWTNFGIDGRDVPAGTRLDGMYHLDAGSAAARAFIDRHHDEPFFLYVAYRAPHVPLDPTKKYLDRFPGEMPERRRKALAMLSAVDDGVGGIVAKLREHDIEDRTIVFYLGDNGAPLKIHKEDAPGGGPGWDGSLNDPLNGEKGMLTEGGIRVPFVVSWKGRIPGGQVYDHPVISLDVAATALALAGVPDDPKLDGVNLVPFLTGDRDGPPHARLFWRWVSQSAVREGRWKYLRGGSREYLFDVVADREEKRDRLADHPEIAARLRGKLGEWARDLDPSGLETKSPAGAWERYFDHYLDGKPVPRGAGDPTRPVAVAGWTPRSSTVEVVDGVLRVKSERGSEGRGRRPFLAAAGLDLRPEVKATVRLRSSRKGTAAISWRERGQKDFPREQTVEFPCTDTWAERTVELPAKGPVIHVRLVLPTGGAEIDDITFEHAKGKRAWTFDAPNRGRRSPR